MSYLVRRLGQLAWRNGEIEKAIELCKENLNFNQKVGDLRGVIACLAGFVAIAIAQGKLKHAAQLISIVEAQLPSTGLQLLNVDKIEYDHNLLLLHNKLEEEALNKFRAKGRG